MSLLNIKGLTHGFTEKNIYKSADLEFNKGDHMGLVGANGCGKSTLLKIILGELIADEGTILWQNNVKIGHLDQGANLAETYSIETYLKGAYQHLYKLEKKLLALYESMAETGSESLLEKADAYQNQLLEANFYEIDHIIQKLGMGLGLDKIGYHRPLDQLSGGQRAKVILARLLLEDYDLIVLDEPTNFLDKEHVAWLADYLKQYQGSFIVVSHNIEFLGCICNCVADVEWGRIKKYTGPFDSYLMQKKHSREAYLKEYTAQQREIQKTEAFIRKNKAGVNCKMARGRQKQLDRLERLEAPKGELIPKFNFEALDKSSSVGLEVKALGIGYDRVLIDNINFTMGPKEKIVVTGFNGIGKSTLLKTLVQEIPQKKGDFQFGENMEIGYFPQEFLWENDDLTPIDWISENYSRMTLEEIRKALAQCGLSQDHVSRPLGTLSGGEQAKVKICDLMLKPSNFLILDEPTNHLDREAKRVLREALEQYEGSLILVSHEKYFYKDWVDKVIDIKKS